ncbi:DUF2510 domain-containing protein [Microbacterium lushaniae]|uniref:DUF2510 domain-containing protein n=1 Tax=Microbacterium lushaniae TaxID=2614639 RepID=A0A5J6L392_9MICO|nr:DUF2510 domain-containing protein [Microbacterium lushaniae]
MTRIQPGWFPDPSDGATERWWDGTQWTGSVRPSGATQLLPPPPSRPRDSGRRRVPVWLWVVMGVVALILAVVLSPIVALMALVVLITGIVALAKGTPTWLKFGSRKATMAITAAAALVFFATGSVSAAIYPTSTPVETSRDRAAAISTRSPSPEPAHPSPSPVTTTTEEVVVQPVPFERTTVEDGSIPRGQSQVATAGLNGERVLTYRVTTVDGKETARELVSDVVRAEPVTEVTAVGTLDPPPAPAPEPVAQGSGCDPNYADGCVPVASDVDCAGGSGNGPAYLQGTARVVGSDVYDLDRDGDGIACNS